MGIDEDVTFHVMENVWRHSRHLTDEQVKIMVEHGVPQWYIDYCSKTGHLYPSLCFCQWMRVVKSFIPR